MRIRHVVCVAPPRLGGMGTAALRWCEGLKERGHEVELVVPQTKGYQPTHTLIRPWPTWAAWGNGAILKRVDDLAKDVDVLHLHLPFYGVEEFILRKRLPVPCVASFHMDAYQTGLLGVLIRAHQRLVQPWLFRQVDRFFASSLDYVRNSSVASHLEKYPDRWQELPFFVDDQRFHPVPRATANHLRILFVSVLDRAHLFKGLPVLLDALARVPLAHLTIVGDGDQRALFEQMVLERGLETRVTFVGRLSQEGLIQAYQKADVLAFPSTNQAEAFGLVALEAQACGTPVIASSLPGVRTLVRDGETGLLVQPGSVDALVDALTSISEPILRERLGMSARVWVEKRFRRATLLDQLEASYRDICG